MHYDVSDVQEMLTKIASAEPEKRYVRPDWTWCEVTQGWNRTGCSYVHQFDSNGDYISPKARREVARVEAGCIIGKMLIEEVGMPMEWFNEGPGRGQTIELISRDIENTTDHKFSREAISYMGIVQRAQDDGESWFNAVRKADFALETGQIHVL